jgi:hypothetical protein
MYKLLERRQMLVVGDEEEASDDPSESWSIEGIKLLHVSSNSMAWFPSSALKGVFMHGFLHVTSMQDL